MRYNILWIDDQFDQQLAFIALAGDHGLKIFPHKVSLEGINEYEKNMQNYDAILLDAKVFNTSENESPTTEGLMNSIFRLRELQHKKYTPYFVFTGQADLYSSKDFEHMLPGISIYKKAIENEKLFDDLKKSIDRTPEAQLRIKHQQVFEIFSNNLLDQTTEALLIKVLKDSHKSGLEDIKGNLTILRSIQESLYNSLKKNGIIPSHLTKFNEIKKHLDGNPDPKNEHKPTGTVYQNSSVSILSNTLYWVSGQYIHNLENQNYIISQYSVKTLLNSLMELLLWYKDLITKTKK